MVWWWHSLVGFMCRSPTWTECPKRCKSSYARFYRYYQSMPNKAIDYGTNARTQYIVFAMNFLERIEPKVPDHGGVDLYQWFLARFPLLVEVSWQYMHAVRYIPPILRYMNVQFNVNIKWRSLKVCAFNRGEHSTDLVAGIDSIRIPSCVVNAKADFTGWQSYETCQPKVFTDQSQSDPVRILNQAWQLRRPGILPTILGTTMYVSQ